MITLVLGGARSGKSSYAEQIALRTNKNVTYLATAQSFDDEMRSRISRHQEDRPASWETVEVPLKLSEAIYKRNSTTECLLIDCLTLWISNQLMLVPQPEFNNLRALFIASLKDSNSDIIIVSNEVNKGIVPLGALSRSFVDQSGWTHQAIASIADNVVLVTAGIPLYIKGQAT